MRFYRPAILSFFLAVSLALGLWAGALTRTARAETAATPLAGTWTGQVQALGAAARITLTLQGEEAKILWGGKAQCRTVQTYSGSRAPSTALFTVTHSGGGYCDRFWNGEMALTPRSGSQLDAVFLNARHEPLLETNLTRRRD